MPSSPRGSTRRAWFATMVPLVLAAVVSAAGASPAGPGVPQELASLPTVTWFRVTFSPWAILLVVVLVYVFVRMTHQSARARHTHGHGPQDLALVRIATTARWAGHVAGQLLVGWERLRKIVLDDPPEAIQSAAGAITFGWGAVIAWPGFAMFDQAPSYGILRDWAPEWAWGSAMTASGLLLLVGVGRERPRWVRAGAFGCWALWTLVSAAFIVYNWRLTSTISCPFFALLSYWGYYRTQPLLVPGRTRLAYALGVRRRPPTPPPGTARTPGTPAAPAPPPAGHGDL